MLPAFSEQHSFLLLDPAGSELLVVDREGCRRRHAPFSSFKLPHTLIALETGVLEGPDTYIEWDRRRFPAEDYWPSDWRQGQTLHQAVRRSVAHYFIVVAERIGDERMRKYLKLFDYGNGDISGGQGFWLASSLEISCQEQVRFLHRFRNSEFGLSQRTRTLAEPLFLHRSGKQWALYGKTGSGPENEGFRGWLVGWLSTQKGDYCYALTMWAEDYAGVRDRRAQLVDKYLRQCGLVTD